MRRNQLKFSPFKNDQIHEKCLKVEPYSSGTRFSKLFRGYQLRRALDGNLYWIYWNKFYHIQNLSWHHIFGRIYNFGKEKKPKFVRYSLLQLTNFLKPKFRDAPCVFIRNHSKIIHEFSWCTLNASNKRPETSFCDAFRIFWAFMGNADVKLPGFYSNFKIQRVI